MAKKSFGKGIDAILGSKIEKETPKKLNEAFSEKDEEVRAIKVCLQVEETLLNNFRAIAHWERLNQREMIEKLIKQYIDQKGEDYLDEAVKCFKVKKKAIN